MNMNSKLFYRLNVCDKMHYIEDAFLMAKFERCFHLFAFNMFDEIVEKCHDTYLLSPFGGVNASISFYSNIIIEFNFAKNNSIFFRRLMDIHNNYVELEPKCLYYVSSFGILASFILLVVHFFDIEQYHQHLHHHDHHHHRGNISSKNLYSYVVSYFLLYVFKILYYKVAFLNAYFFLYSVMVFITAFLTLITIFDTYLVIRHSIMQFRIINYNIDSYMFSLYSLCGWGIPIFSCYFILYFEQVTINEFVYFVCFAEVVLRMLSTILLLLTFLTLKKSTMSKFSSKFYARLVVLSGSVFLMSSIESLCNALNYFMVIDVYILCAVRYSSDVTGAYEGVIIFYLFAPKRNRKPIFKIFRGKTRVTEDASLAKINSNESTSLRRTSDYHITTITTGTGHESGVYRYNAFRSLQRTFTRGLSFYVANK